MQMMVETWSRNSIKTLKAVIDGKSLTLNFLGQHLRLLEARNFHRKPSRKQTNLAFEMRFGTNVEQGMLFQMTSRKLAIAPENLEILLFLNVKNSSIFNSSDLIAFKFIMLSI